MLPSSAQQHPNIHAKHALHLVHGPLGATRIFLGWPNEWHNAHMGSTDNDYQDTHLQTKTGKQLFAFMLSA